jgi:hypothetical protein
MQRAEWREDWIDVLVCGFQSDWGWQEQDRLAGLLSYH